MSEKMEKKKRIEQKLMYPALLEAWLAAEPVWWRLRARKQWRSRRPQKHRIIARRG